MEFLLSGNVTMSNSTFIIVDGNSNVISHVTPVMNLANYFTGLGQHVSGSAGAWQNEELAERLGP